MTQPSAKQEEPLSPPFQRHCWLIAGGAFLLRLAASVASRSLWHPKYFEYEDIARALLAGRGFVYQHIGGVTYYAFDAPLYPWICAAVYALTHASAPALMLIQILAGSLACFFIGMIGGRQFGWRAGLIAASLVAVHPGLIVYAGLKAYQLVFDVLCFIAVLWQLLRGYERRSLRQSLLLGLVMGISLLQRSTAIAFIPVGLAWLLFTASSGRRWKEFLRAIATCNARDQSLVSP